ncbi:MAG TPA: hypothetical protein VG672_09570 [Bryobacteraceae bacterium]|nr:hypothetical protein [Bryobacteraceae bacterium]
MSARLRSLVGAYVAGLLVAVLYFLVKLWPVTRDSIETSTFLWGQFALPLEARYLLLAALAGALGSYIHLATSFADYAGNDCLAASWTWWYLIRPFIGAALAEVVYLAIRAGVVTGTGGADALSPFGIAAICSLSGLFARQATDKLREIFENLFRTEKQIHHKDPLPHSES